MNNDIIDIIVNTPESEDAGSRTQNRFDYQSHWAICHLLELHEEGVDFVLAAECHDDVLEILPDAPKRLNFYQIKTTKNGNINISSDNKISMTYLGKMLCHLQRFGNDVGNLTLISNRPFKEKIGKRASSEFDCQKLIDFQDKNPRLIWEAAAETISDVGLKAKVKALNFSPEIFTFKVSDLPLDNFSEMTKGKIITFLEKYRRDQAALPFYQALLAEIKRQSNREKKTLEKKDFIQNRSIDKKHFDKIVKEVIEQPLMKERIASVIKDLESSGIAWGIKKQYKEELKNLEIDLYAKNSYYHLLSEMISVAYSKIYLETLSFYEIIEQIYLSIKDDKLVKEACLQKTELYVKACIALRINE